MKKSTEKSSNYNDIEKMDTISILQNINKEDQLVALAVYNEISKIEELVDAIYTKMLNGGRLFYIGAGTSGRLGIVDASECPPTFGVEHGLVVGLIAGGDSAIRKAVEFAEDDINQAWSDLKEYDINIQDSVIGIAASGSTPYVIGAIKECNKHNILTASICCNYQSPLSEQSKYPIEVIVGPEFITGSTRMKAGTAQKLVLNMISTALMVKLGKVVGNKMVDMQLSNNKLVDRGTKMVMEETNLDYDKASSLLKEFGSVRKAIENNKDG
jgi:N-acetylmuramic acid 6-phosphate etherase